MYLNITSHNAKVSPSSSGVFAYLEKENAYAKIKNQHLILDGKEEEIDQYSEEHFFNQNFNPYDLDDPNSKINQWEASEAIDKNRGTQSLKSANFYMLNLSPSQKEQEHMEKLAIEELANRGLNYEECKDDSVALGFYNEQKDQLMKLQLKLYTKEVMDEYARQMDREIYANQDKLPSNAERKQMQPEIDRLYQEFLEEKGVRDKIGNEYLLLNFEKKVSSEIGNTYTFKYNGQEEVVFAKQDKVKEISSNLLAIEKSYFENKIQEEKDKKEGIYNDEKIKLKVQIDKETDNSTMITFKPDNYEKDVKLWINNKDFKKIDEGEIEINNYKANKLISSAIERDKEQNQMLEVQGDFTVWENKEGMAMLTFSQEVNGLKEPIQFTFKESELEQRDGKFYVERYKLEFRQETAKEKAIQQEFGDIKEEIKNKVWKENGFDVTKRKVTGKDLLYFAKVETERVYKHTDKAVLKNRPILEKIKKLEDSKGLFNKSKIEKLQKELLRDKYTGEVIKEGVKKGGLNYHVHIVASRHDATSINPRDKVSMSPKAHQKGGHMNNGAKVGFDRDAFFKKIEQIFDEKFEYDRPQKEKYVYKNYQKKSSLAKGLIKSEIQKQMMELLGINEIKKEINPMNTIRQEIMPLPIPTNIPKSKLELVIQIVKTAKNIAMGQGLQY